VLDIGAAFGHFSRILKQDFDNVCAVDHYNYHKNELEAEGIHFVIAELARGTLPFDREEFDLVVFTEVLEHLFVLPHAVLLEINRITKPGGFLVLSTPNLLSLYKRLRFLKGISPMERASMKRDGGVAQGHVREYSMQELCDILVECDFEIKETRYLHSDPATQESALFKAYCVLERTRPTFAETLFIIAQKK
jgi:2-polyprenyl-3-methyl-5-hydroxy-6-metoxy-1,4-benzoquinol methylase